MSQKALFVWGGWEGHEPRQCTELIAPLIEQAGLDVEISDTLAAFDDAKALAACDVIVPCWTMGELAPEREAALVDAIRGGVGLAGWHGGMGDAFRAAADYQFMVGGQFVAHPGGIIDYDVEIVDRDHPITRHISDFPVNSEQYYLHIDPTNHVLAETPFTAEHAPWIPPCRMPVAWVRRFGQGRVFYCSIGHVADDLRIPQAQEIVRRGILWAADALEEIVE
jgi:type 1 glutamine amidotransferase